MAKARRYKTSGSRKYICRDCGATFMATWRATWETATNRNHCVSCGSTFIDPYSRGAHESVEERVDARDNLSPLRDFDSVDDRRT